MDGCLTIQRTKQFSTYTIHISIRFTHFVDVNIAHQQLKKKKKST